MSSASDVDASVLDRLYEVIQARQRARPEGSYVVQLFDGGWEAISAKVREESQEVIDAARDEGDDELTHEVADLLFHTWVLMASRGVSPDAVYAELAGRFGIGGLEEKAARTGERDRESMGAGVRRGSDDDVAG